MNLYKSNSLVGKFTKEESLKIQGELHEKEEKLKIVILNWWSFS